MIDTVIRHGEKRVHVLEVDVGELPGLKDFKVLPENQDIADRLTLVWGRGRRSQARPWTRGIRASRSTWGA